MRYVLAPVGTRGDFQPLWLLARRLRARGHTVVLAVAPEFAAGLPRDGWAVHPVGRDLTATMSGVGDAVDGGTRLIAQLRADLPEHFARLEDICQGADVLVGAGLQLAGPSVAEKLRLAYAYTVFWPNLYPSASYAPVGIPFAVPPALLGPAWTVTRAAWTLHLRGAINRQRARLGLAPVSSVLPYLAESGTRLLAFDTTLGHRPELSGPSVATGSWLEDPRPDERLAPALEAFLEDGPAPLYFGFGSMKHHRPAAQVHLFLRAAEAAGGRALIHSGPAPVAGLALPRWAALADGAPHRLLFPRVAGIVHHGGAGTTIAAALAGKPQWVVPHLCDQFYWGQRVAQMGLGPPPCFRPLLSERWLTESVRKLLGGHDNARAAACAPQIARDGLDRAVAAVEALGGPKA